MKKILALLLTALLAAAAFTAFAEEAEKPFIDFDIKMDSIPEGYEYDVEERGGSLFATFRSADPAAAVLYVSVAYSDTFAGYTLSSQMSDEEFESATKLLTADYNDPSIELRETDYGTAVIVITENDAQSDYADMITVWHGYFIRAALQKSSQLTEEDMALAMRIASDMWFVEQ